MSIEKWARQPGESNKAFYAFTLYRDMGHSRSLSKVAQILHVSKTWVSQWCGEHKWVDRVSHWDDKQDEVLRNESIEARKDMAARHAKLAMMFQETVIARFKDLKPKELSTKDVATWADIAVKIERLARGESTENVNSEITGKDGAPLEQSVHIYIPSNGRDDKKE